jgi:hypothetical protein
MIVDNDSLEAHPSPQKIGSVHFQRLAVVYVRQSTAQQVLRHEESTRLQYGLVGRARQLGWPEERIVVIDDDLGHSAAEGEHRAGFKRLVSEVSLVHVGMILEWRSLDWPGLRRTGISSWRSAPSLAP